MTKKFFRKRTKRLSTKERVKQEKKLRDHNRKVRKDKKKTPGKYAKSKKDPGVPNVCPFKEEVLKECAEARQRKEEMKQKKRDELKQRREESKEKALQQKRTGGLEGLVADAQHKLLAHEAKEALEKEAMSKGVSDRSAKAYYREFVKVIDAADVVLQVLDARDPMGTRCQEVEDAVLNSGTNKRLVLVLNKADLVPKDNLEKWLKYLRAQLPTIAFKASTQVQGDRLGQSAISVKKSTDTQMKTSKCVGASTLTALLANYCRNRDIKTTIRVGVVGLPNVGKSSLINSLKRSRSCGVGAVPGFTRAMQEVQLDKKVKLLDSPGMVLASGNMTDSGVALRNALRIDSLEDPITPVEAILQRCPKQQMILQYHVSDYDDTNEFLSLVARSIGRLKRGGVPDVPMAAKMILNDWNSGKIKYFTHPPETEAELTGTLSSEIITEFSKEFQLDHLDKMDEEDMGGLPTVLPSQTMLVGSSGILKSAKKRDEIADETSQDGGESKNKEMDQDEDGENENAGQLSGNISILASEKNEDAKRDVSSKPLFLAQGLNKLKQVNKLREKKAKKELRRRDKVSAELSHGMETAFSSM